MEKRKRDSLDSDGTSPKRFKNGPTVCQSENEVYAMLRSKKAFVFTANVDSFTLPQDCATLEHLKRLTRALLDEGNQLQQFNIIHGSEILSYDRVASILQSLKNCSTLKSLVISNVDIKFTELVPLLKKKTLRILAVTSPSRRHTIMNNKISDIANDIIACTSLKSVDFSGNLFESLEGIDKVITQHKYLRSVKLSGCELGQETMAAIAAFVQSTKTLTTLDLSETNLTDDNLMKLAQSLEKNKTLTSLNINQTTIASCQNKRLCGNAIVNMLQCNNTLTTLKMREIPLVEHEVAILKALQNSDVIQELGMTIRTNGGTDQLGIMLQHITALSKLDVNLPNLMSFSLAKLATGITNNTTLKHLAFSSRCWQFDSNKLSLLGSAFESNRTLLSIELAIPDYKTKACAKQVTMRNNAIVTFDRTLIKAFIDNKDWDGMWNFVKQNLANDFLFEDLIDKNHYNLDDYEEILSKYLKQSAAYHKEQLSKKKQLDKDICDNNKTIEKTHTKIVEAERIIEESKALMKEARSKLGGLSEDLHKVEQHIKVESYSQERMEAEHKRVKEQTKGLAKQFKRPVETWSLDEVIIFIRDLQLHMHIEKFTENEIKGDVLVNLTTLDFHQLGMGFKEIKSLMSSIFELKHFKSLSDIPDGILYWTNKQVLNWLEVNKFQHLVNQFQNCKITGEDLVVLDNYDLTHWLKIETIADRTALEAAIKRLRAELESLANNDTAQKKIPKQFLCPITHEIMKDPVSTIDGHTYEQAAIESWLKKKSTSPLTNETLASKQLIPNHQLKSLIAEFLGEAG